MNYRIKSALKRTRAYLRRLRLRRFLVGLQQRVKAIKTSVSSYVFIRGRHLPGKINYYFLGRIILKRFRFFFKDVDLVIY